jgi:hypothetical protein
MERHQKEEEEKFQPPKKVMLVSNKIHYQVWKITVVCLVARCFRGGNAIPHLASLSKYNFY